MRNSVRGSHSSPGVYSREIDFSVSAQSLGLTKLGLVGETQFGPAFEPIKIEKWSDFETYFGGTSSELFKTKDYLPKYQLPYVAKEYLKESSDLHVCRVLGLSGYDADSAWTITVTVNKKGENNEDPESEKIAVAVLRAKGSYNGEWSSDICTAPSGGTHTVADIKEVVIGAYSGKIYDSTCSEVSPTGTTETGSTQVTSDNLGRFTLKITTGEGTGATVFSYPVSFNSGESDYIFNVFGNSNESAGEAPVFVEAFYDYALADLASKIVAETAATVGDITSIEIKFEKIDPTTALRDYQDKFKAAATPYLLSQMNVSDNIVNMKRLFRVITISDGKAANKQIKISIQNIRPDEGTFDLLVRSFYDSDAAPVILEKYSKCSMIEGSDNYVALRIGTINGEYELKSKYIALEMGKHLTGNENLVPCGFEGYDVFNFGTGITNADIAYKTTYDPNVKAKKQYFGLVNVDEDILAYKGRNVTQSNGFHLDSILEAIAADTTITGDTEIFIDGEKIEGAKFSVVSAMKTSASKGRIPRILTEAYMKETIYEDVNLRKFTVYPFGGFDGWDIYRTERTNTNDFKATKYNGKAFELIDKTSERTDDRTADIDLPIIHNVSDYYAFLAGCRLFADKEDIDINLFATPGLDFNRNELLVEDIIEIIEDADDGRGGDALYIIDSPFLDNPQEVVNALENTSIDTSYAASYWPWVKCFDSEDNKYINLPVTKDVVRNMAYTDNISYPWFSPAGMQRGDVVCVRPAINTKINDEDTLYDGRINPVKRFAVDGVKIWGNKTLYSLDTPLNRVNVRRLMIRVKKLVESAARNLIFEQYDGTLKSQFLALVTPILSEVQANRGIYDFRISVDDSVEARDAHTLPATIAIKPTPALEYVELTFTIYPESVDFQS